MKRIALTLLGVVALTLSACEDGADSLSNGHGSSPNRSATAPGETAGGDGNTFNHSNDPGGAAPGAEFQPPEPAQMKVVGSPEVTSRLHACGKLSIASIAQLIQSRALSGGAPQGAQNAQQILNASGPALGAANYPGRVPEAPFASTSAMAKMFDIYAMGSYAAVNANWSPPACPGVKMLGGDGKINKDALSCLMGKPATDAHVAIANDAITRNPTDGLKIAVAAILSAAHTCQ